MVKKSTFVLIATFGLATAALAQTDTIHVPRLQLQTQYLKPGMNQYLVTIQNIKSPKTLFLWYWLRDIKVSINNNIPVFVINQHWYGTDTLNYRSVYSINKRSDFAPLYHAETAGGKTGAYNWTRQKITGADTVAGNARKSFSLDFKQPNLNWNLDIETFEMLPLGEGKVFAINFYDAGLTPPADVIYKVTGSDQLSYDGKTVDCWKLYNEGSYNNGKYNETYWISKKDHEFLQEKDEYGSGMYRTKIKMLLNMDLLEKLNK